MRRRHLLLGLALVGSAMGALWMPGPVSEVVEPVARAARVPVSRARLPELDVPGQPGMLRLIPRTAVQEEAVSPFTVPAWALPKPPAKTAEPAAPSIAEQAAPQAPPAPFKVIGRYEESGQPPGFFLEHQQKTMVARTGDQLTPEWKVESAEAGRIVLQYLPSSQSQTLEWASP